MTFKKVFSIIHCKLPILHEYVSLPFKPTSKEKSMEYNHSEIEKRWQKEWAENKTFKAEENSEKPKFYSLDMFPYPSGAGLHVGHPLGYIASDIYSRYKRLTGYNVLHPMGYDSFGLPAEQYAIQTGQHPELTTKTNVERYRQQMDQIGFSFDWAREVRTSSPEYYKWTQWIFKQLFNSWYNKASNKAEKLETLTAIFETEGNANVKASCAETEVFTTDQWSKFTEKEQSDILMNYRLAFLSDTMVNWCPALGTVLANDEIKDGVSERGGHPVVQKLMRQWSMRITAYAERLIQGLDTIDWSDSIKEQQKNWIGKSKGAMVSFPILNPSLREGLASQSHSAGTAGYMTGGNYSHLLLEKAKEMRANPTEAEAFIWAQLKGKQLGVKFRQQHLIDDFIADFVCLSKKLIIEVDGKIHDSQKEQDEARTAVLENLDYKVIRFTNEEVIMDIENVLKKIKKELAERPDLTSNEPANSEPANNSKANVEVLPLGKDLGWDKSIEVFTTRPDTIFGVNFMVLAPEHELVADITTPEQKEEVEAYIHQASLKTERDRQANVKNITGVNTGAFAIHPFTGEKVQIWIGDYVLAGYGTGAVMAVPAGDQRDWAFATHFGIEIKNIFENVDISEGACEDKSAILTNSDFLNGLNAKKGIGAAIKAIQEKGCGRGMTNFRLRDAIFSRQRYWGEPFPVYFENEIPKVIEDEFLPIELPEVEKYLPTEDGEPPLGNANTWSWCKNKKILKTNDKQNGTCTWPMELNTMPGWAGSSWYFLRYMDPQNEGEFVSKEKADYWGQVDLYIGGAEHATGHLLYSRFWTKFLYDMGYISFEEPFKKLINQGMILGRSSFVYRDKESGKFVSFDKRKEYKTARLHTDISFVNNDKLDIEAFKNWREEYKNAEFITNENGDYICGSEIEKMSKSKYNVQTPDELVAKFGADTLRCYEMFLGPLEQAKPWDTNGISGVNGFLKKLWRLFHHGEIFNVNEREASKESMKTLHTAIKKVTEDLERYSFNTIVSGLMIAVNELTVQKCANKEVLEKLLVLVSPYAPHIAEEIWNKLGHTKSITFAQWPEFKPEYLLEANHTYPVSFNGKMRFKIELPTELSKEEIEKEVMAHQKTAHYLEGKSIKKLIIVPKKIVNIVM